MFFEIDELKEKLRSEDPNERQEACYHLGKLEIREAFRVLEQAVKDPDPMVQMIAAKSLTRLAMLGLGTITAPLPAAAPKKTVASPLPVSVVPVAMRTPEAQPASPPPSAPPVAPRPKVTLTPPPFAPISPPAPPPPAPAAVPPAHPVIASPAAPVAPVSLVAKAVPPAVKPASTQAPEEPVADDDQPDLPPLKVPPPPVVTPAPRPEAMTLPDLAAVPAPTTAPAPVPALEEQTADDQPDLPPLKTPPPPAAKAAPVQETAPVQEAGAAQETAPVAPPPPPEKRGPLEGELAKWKEKIQAREDSFGVWFSKLARQDKIDVLAEMEKGTQNILWSKKIQTLLYAETDAFALSKLLKVFGRLHGPRILKYVEPFLEHSDTRVVSNTLEALSLAGDKEDLERITQFLDHQDARIKSTAAQALWRSNPQRAMEVVKRLAASSRVWERDAAKFALASCPLDDRKGLLESLTKPKNKAAPPPKGPEGPVMPDWAKSLGPLGRFLVFPIHLGMAEPIPIWVAMITSLTTLLFYLVILNPFFNWIFPPP